MGMTKERQKEVLSKISAINTLLERYPVLTTTDPMLTNFSVNTSIGFLLSVLEVFGISQADIVNWLCRLLGDKDGGVLEAIEYAIKGVLLFNIKGLFSCNFNPILPDNLMKYAVDTGTSRQDPNADFPYNPEKNDHIEINIQEVDMFGLLANCPSNEKGGIFYFDAFDPYELESVEDHNDSGETIIRYYKVPNYTPDNLYKSRDFNAFLWYVINKGNIGSPDAKQRNTWDNRNKAYKYYDGKPDVKEAFFNPVKEDKASLPDIPITITVDGKEKDTDIKKQQYIICQYAERGSNQAYSNILNVWINADRYYRTRKWNTKKGGTICTMNRTIYEFNYDYIYSLKLFDTKTLIANIANSLLGLSASLSFSFSHEQKVIQKKVEAMVEKIISQSDTEVSEDCFYKFDNTTYQQMINSVTKSYNGSYLNPDPTYDSANDDIFSNISALGGTNGKECQSDLIKRTIESISKPLSNQENDETTSVNSFRIGADFITNFVKQTAIQIILQVLSPKVAILYAINSQIMGGTGNITEWATFMENFDSLMKSVIVTVKDIIVKELYNFTMEKLKPILELLINKLALETIKYYKDLIMDLIANCIPSIRLGSNGSTVIDNVNYADIILENPPTETTQTMPNSIC